MEQKSFYQRCREKLEAMGGTYLPRDHPVYSEPPSIVFLSRKPGQKDQKAIVSLPEDSPSDSDRPRKKKKKK